MTTTTGVLDSPSRGRRAATWLAGAGLSLGFLGAASAAGASLPERPSIADVKAGVAPHLAEAHACGPALDATPGEKVTIKLRIEGATGTVTESSAVTPRGKSPDDPHGARGAVGMCVAAALGKATFPRFSTPSVGVLYPVRMPPGLYGPYAPSG